MSPSASAVGRSKRSPRIDDRRIRGVDGKTYPAGSILGTDGRYYPKGYFLGSDQRYHLSLIHI